MMRLFSITGWCFAAFGVFLLVVVLVSGQATLLRVLGSLMWILMFTGNALYFDRIARKKSSEGYRLDRQRLRELVKVGMPKEEVMEALQREFAFEGTDREFDVFRGFVDLAFYRGRVALIDVSFKRGRVVAFRIDVLDDKKRRGAWPGNKADGSGTGPDR